MTRFILFLIFGYFLYLGIKHIYNLFAARDQQNINQMKKNKAGSKIDNKDIIEADFEEIDQKEKK